MEGEDLEMWAVVWDRGQARCFWECGWLYVSVFGFLRVRVYIGLWLVFFVKPKESAWVLANHYSGMFKERFSWVNFL